MGQIKVRQGQATVEFALILPVFLLIMAGTIEFGRAFWSYGLLLQAAQEGARQGAVLGSATNDTAITTTTQQTAAKGGLTLSASDVVISATCSYTSSTSIAAANRSRGNVLTVQAKYRFTPLIPFLPMTFLNLTTSSSMEIEQGAPSTCT
jgi:Flp pilus assembly protein TadG